MSRGNPFMRQIADHFGKGVVQQDGRLDRLALGEDCIR